MVLRAEVTKSDNCLLNTFLNQRGVTMSTKIISTAAIARNALLSMLLTIVISVTATAGTPQLIGYQALLSDSAGNPLNQTVNVVFRIWNDSIGGTAVWTETHNSIQIINGKLSVLLGSLNPLDDDVFGDTGLYLGIRIGLDAE